MGLLDDAIRDHLELKRRHGADPGEVARIENEALSAARREAAPAAAGVEEAVAEDDEVYDLEDDPDAAPEAAAPVDHKDPEPEAVYEHELEDAEPDTQSTQQYSLEELEAQAARDEVAPGQPRPRAPESAEPPPAEPGEEDVLEETPEFLQETPEHDRLWFEQKPPKDFDF